MPKRVLVTGGSGLVGSAVRHVVEKESGRFGGSEGEEWIFVASKECDLRNYEETKKLFEKYKPDYILHLAAKVGGLFANMAEPATFMNDNLAMNDSVLRNAHEFGVKKVVSCLSTCIFPDKVEYPLTEAKIHLGPPHDSNFAYAYAKRLVDVQNRAYHQQYGCMFTSVIPTNVFGPHDNFHLKNAHVIPALIHKCYNAQQEGKPLVVGGSGKPLRQFIYSRDLARLMVWAVREYEDVEPLILSPPADAEISIAAVAETIARSLGNAQLEWDPSLPDGQFRKPASNEKLAVLLPEFEYTDFEKALGESCQWFVDNYNTARR